MSSKKTIEINPELFMLSPSKKKIMSNDQI